MCPTAAESLQGWFWPQVVEGAGLLKEERVKEGSQSRRSFSRDLCLEPGGRSGTSFQALCMWESLL